MNARMSSTTRRFDQQIADYRGDGLGGGRPRHRLFVGLTARGLAQQAQQQHRQRHAQESKGAEHGAPAVVLGKPPRASAAGDGAGIYARLVKRHGAGAGGDAVIIADQRHRRREVERFAETAERAAESKLPEVMRQRGTGRGDGPEDERAEDQPLARPAVAAANPPRVRTARTPT